MQTFNISYSGAELDAVVQALKMLNSITTATLQSIDAQAGAQLQAMQKAAADKPASDIMPKVDEAAKQPSARELS